MNRRQALKMFGAAALLPVVPAIASTPAKPDRTQAWMAKANDGNWHFYVNVTRDGVTTSYLDGQEVEWHFRLPDLPEYEGKIAHYCCFQSALMTSEILRLNEVAYVSS